MFRYFRERRLWAAVIIALILGPVSVMAYLRRGRLALFYAFFPLIPAGLMVANQSILPNTLGTLDALILLIIAFYLAAVIHAGIVSYSSKVPSERKWYGTWPAVLLIFLLPVIAAKSWKAFAFEAFDMTASSMAPTLVPGDHLLAAKAAFGYGRYSLPFDLPPLDGRVWFTPPKRGDLIVFRLPSDPTIAYIKRVVGLPGDRVQMIDGAVSLNGVMAEREGIEPYTMPSCGTQAGKIFSQYLESLPEGATYRILDSGLSDMDDTEAYDVPEDHYFVLGDHRDNSIDSRWSGQVGMVHKRYLVGRVTTLYASGCDAPLRLTWRRIPG